MSYYEKVQGKKFNELVEDTEFQKDLIKFFTGNRYNYSKKDIEELGPAGLADRFIDHMRYQDTNEATVAKDLFFINRARKQGDNEALDSFGRLMMAWDSSEGAGTGVLDGAKDYAGAFLSSPSTLATVFTAGVAGPMSKFTSATAKKAGQIALRKTMMNSFAKEGAKSSLKRAAVGGALRGATIEGTTGAAMALGQEEAREETVEGYEKDTTKVAAAGAISAAAGGVLGAFARTRSVSEQNAAMDIMVKQGDLLKKKESAAAQNVQSTLQKAAKGGPSKSKELKPLVDRVSKLVQLLEQKEKGSVKKFKKALDEDLVSEGKKISDKIFGSTNNEFVTNTFTSNTFRKVAAATLDVANELSINLNSDIRITQQVASALQSNKISADTLDAIRNKYGMSRRDFSLVFLSDMSEAGRILNVGSQIKKGLSKADAEAAAVEATKDINGVLDNLDRFAQQGFTNSSDETLRQMSETLLSTKAVNSLREFDSLRIGMMTSQLATTAANVGTGIARVGLDMPNRMFLNIIEGRNPVSGVLDVLKNVTWGKEEAMVARALANLDDSSNSSKLFYDITRVENATGSNSFASRATRWVNWLNTTTDVHFKQAVFYSSLQRQIRDKGDEALGKTFEEYLSKNVGLEALPEGMVQKANRDALSFSFQWGYEGSKDWFGKSTRTVINANKRYPFLISSFMPFPRYVANQLEFMHRYLPTGLAQGLWEKASGQGSRNALVSSNEKIAEGMTGTMLLLSAVSHRLQADSDTTYREFKDPVSNEIIDATRLGGPFMAHLFIGDLIARYIKGEDPLKKMSELGQEAIEVATGLNSYGFSVERTVTPIVESLEDGEPTEALSKWLGDLAATFTMPLATVRDIRGQFSEEAMATPYTREVEPEGGFLKSQLMQRATRFLPDFDWIQYSSSFNGKNDIPLYDPFLEEPVMKINPLMSQLTGLDYRPKKTEISQELNRLNMKGWRIYSSRKVKNPNTDLAVRQRLSKTLNKEFTSWRDNKVFSGNRMYKDLPIDEQQNEFKNFVLSRINTRQGEVDKQFEKFSREAPNATLGWIINNYAIQSKRYETELGGLDRVITAGTGRDISASDYLDEAEDVEDRAARMTKILEWAEMVSTMERNRRD